MRLIVFVALLVATTSHAVDVTLAWDPSEDAESYVVYWDIQSQPPGGYAHSLNVGNVTQTLISGLDADTTYYFVAKAFATIDGKQAQSPNSREVSFLSRSTPLSDGEQQYDAEWGITAGDSNLTGFKVLFESSEGVPTLGAADSLPGLDLPGIQALGLPLNLQPAGASLKTPVKIFLPCLDPAVTSIYYYGDVATDWKLANAADTPDVIEPAAQGWMVAWHDNSNHLRARENNPTTTPPTVAIKVQHFSGVQAAIPAGSGSSGGGGGGGCLIAAAAFESHLYRHPLLVLIGLGLVLLVAACWRLRPVDRREKGGKG